MDETVPANVVTTELIAGTTGRAEPRKPASAKTKRGAEEKPDKARFTHRQGQFLAFIHMYRLLHRQGPAELDLVRYFRITPPSAHDMIVRLQELGLVTREPGVPRSIRIAIPESDLPTLEQTDGPPI